MVLAVKLLIFEATVFNWDCLISARALLGYVISERELMFMFAICRRPSVCRLSSVCRLK